MVWSLSAHPPLFFSFFYLLPKKFHLVLIQSKVLKFSYEERSGRKKKKK
jgi:hypothetical protein